MQHWFKAALSAVQQRFKVPKGRQSAALAARLGTTFDHPGRGLTPLKLHDILESAEDGDITAQAELFADVEEKDGHIFAEMSKRKRALIGLPWQVLPPVDATAAEQALAEEVKRWLYGLDDFEALLFDLLDALGHGFAACEIAWQQRDGLWLPATFTHRPQGWFQLRKNALRLRAVDGNPEGEELWPCGWIVHRAQARSGITARGGLMRSLVWPYLFKNYSIRDLAEFLEIYGLPVRIGKYSAGATEEDKKTLLRAVVGIGHNAAGIIPDGMGLELLNAADGNGDAYMAMIGWCEKTASKIILGGTLTSQADGKTSTNALGNVHNEVRHDLLASDARQLAATLTRQLIAPLVMLNRGGIDPARMPYFTFDLSQPEDLAVYADALPKLVGIGMAIPTAWAREKLAIPAAAEGEAVLHLPDHNAMPAPLAAAAGFAGAGCPCCAPRQAALSVTPANASGHQLLEAILDRDAAHNPLNEGGEALAKHLGKLLQQGVSLDALATDVRAAYPDWDGAQMQQVLARALFVANLWGQIHARA